MGIEIPKQEGQQDSEQKNPFEFIPDRNERLMAFNKYLGERGLRKLGGVGNFEDPSMGVELTQIKETYERASKLYTIVTFGAKFFGGAEGEYSLIFKANGSVADGSVFLTRIVTHDGEIMYVLIDQYKIAHNRRFEELPRGFANIEDGDDINLNELGGVKAFRELREEAGITEIKSFKFLGKVPEDTTTNASDANIYLVTANSPKSGRELDLSEQSSVVQYETESEFFESIFGGEIIDTHSNSAFLRAICGDNNLGDSFAKFLLASDAEAKV